jgi:hypothetical protein
MTLDNNRPNYPKLPVPSAYPCSTTFAMHITWKSVPVVPYNGTVLVCPTANTAASAHDDSSSIPTLDHTAPPGAIAVATIEAAIATIREQRDARCSAVNRNTGVIQQ